MWRADGPTGEERCDTGSPAIEAVDLEARILMALGYRAPLLATIRATAERHGLTRAEELIRTGRLDPARWWQAVAETLRLRFYRSVYLVPKAATAGLPPFHRVRQVLDRPSDAPSRLYIAPRGAEIDRLAVLLAADPEVRGRYAIASPIAITRAITEAHAPAVTHTAINHLRQTRPDMSAADAGVLRRRLLIVVAIALMVMLAAPTPSMLLLDTAFLVIGGIRLASAYRNDPRHHPDLLPDAMLPTYSVLVPIYHEAEVVPALAAALSALDYPAGKLSILVIVEADDLDTVAAARRACHSHGFRLIAVPPSLPRTKPKALNWALPFADGELITIFDAEDRPAPDQLRLAASAFVRGGDDLACVQAALDVDHLPASRNWLTRQFALEYRVLFTSLLPWLASHRLFLPLGGTSNHFRGIR